MYLHAHARKNAQRGLGAEGTKEKTSKHKANNAKQMRNNTHTHTNTHTHRTPIYRIPSSSGKGGPHLAAASSRTDKLDNEQPRSDIDDGQLIRSQLIR